MISSAPLLPLALVLVARLASAEAELPVTLDYVTVAPREIGALPLTLTVSADSTRIRDGERLLVVDYARLELRRSDGPDDATQTYPLTPPGETPPPPPPPGDPGHDREASAAHQVASAIARYEISSGSADAPVRGYPVALKTVWFGRGFLEARAAGSLHLAQWGRRFSERRVRLWVSREHPAYAAMAELATAREPILRANPMLAHVDWTLLTAELGGVPVRLEERGRDMLMRLELVPAP